MMRQDISRYRLIDTELTVGISYCRAGLSSGDPERKASNMQLAQRTYDGAVDYVRTSKLSLEMKENLEYKTDCLRALLLQRRTVRVIFKLEPLKT